MKKRNLRKNKRSRWMKKKTHGVVKRLIRRRKLDRK